MSRGARQQQNDGRTHVETAQLGAARLPQWGIGGGFENALFATFRDFAANLGLEVLVTSAVANVQDEAPDKVCSKAAGEYYDQHGNGSPAGAIGQLQNQNLFPDLKAYTLLLGYTYGF